MAGVAAHRVKDVFARHSAAGQKIDPATKPYAAAFKLARDDFSSNRHLAHLFCLSMIFSENRYPLFRIML